MDDNFVKMSFPFEYTNRRNMYYIYTVKYIGPSPIYTTTTITGDFTGIDSAYRPDPTTGSGLTPDNKGTRFLCLVLTNLSPGKLEARGDSK